MLGLHSFIGPRLPAARKTISRTGRACFGMAVRVACLPYTGPVACARRVNQTAVSVAELGLDLACGFVPEVLSVQGVRSFTQHFERSSGASYHHKLNLDCVQGDVLADLSQADLEGAYIEAGVSFAASKLFLDELRHQVIRDTCQQGTKVSKHLPGSCSKSKHSSSSALPIYGTDTDCTEQARAEHASACCNQRCSSAAVRNFSESASRHTPSPCDVVLHSECQRPKQSQLCNKLEAARQISSEAAAAEGIRSISCAEGTHEDVRI